MTTDAPRSNAEQWHIPPQDRRLGEGMSPIPKPAPFVDLEPLILHFERELQRERNNLAVERTAASSAREALVACEERLRQSQMAAEEGMREHDRMRRALEHAECGEVEAQRDAALTLLAEERETTGKLRAQLEQAKTVPPGLVPGGVEAVLEAYRLIIGQEPKHITNTAKAPEWVDHAWPNSALPSPGLGQLYRAAHELLGWLDEHAPGGRP